MDRDAGRFAQSHQAGHHDIGIVADLGQHFAVIVGLHAAHIVVDGRQHRDRLAGHIDAGENLGAFGNARQALMQDRGIEMVQVQIDVIRTLADAASLADFHGHGPRHHVARGQILHGRRIALHEALALGVGEIAALAARALGDQAARSINAGRVELDEFKILDRQSRAQNHAAAVAGAGMGRGGGEIGAAIAAGRQNHQLRAKTVDGAVVEFQADHAAHGAGGVADQIDGEIFDEEFRRILQRLAIKRVQHGVSGAVGGGAGALRRRAAAEIGGHAAEGTLINLAVGGARKRHAPMFELVNGGGRVAAQIFDGVLVSEPVGALDGVIHVPFPIVRPHIGERGRHAALGGHRMGAGRKDFGHAGGAQARLGTADGGAQTRAAGPDHHHVKGVIDDGIGLAAKRRIHRSVRRCHGSCP